MLKVRRTVTDHIVNPVNDLLKVDVVDDPGAGGANHEYLVAWPSGTRIINFQNGPIAENGVNGLTHEVLLAIVADRLRCFQAGPYPSEYNAAALAHVEDALDALKQRTRERMARGVEGKSAQ